MTQLLSKWSVSTIAAGALVATMLASNALAQVNPAPAQVNPAINCTNATSSTFTNISCCDKAELTQFGFAGPPPNYLACAEANCTSFIVTQISAYCAAFCAPCGGNAAISTVTTPVQVAPQGNCPAGQEWGNNVVSCSQSCVCANGAFSGAGAVNGNPIPAAAAPATKDSF
jgi:hypothetical protein